MNNIKRITLDKAKIGVSYYISELCGFDDHKFQRLCDLGFIKNEKITPIQTSMIKGTVAYLIKGSVIALRNDDSKKIYVCLWR